MSTRPARFEPLLSALLLSGLMSLLVPGVAAWKSLGFRGDSGARWLASWPGSWLIAFPAVMVIDPVVRKLVARYAWPHP